MTKIISIKDGDRNLDIKGRVIYKGNPHTIPLKSGQVTPLCDIIIQDATASIKMALWGDQIDLVEPEQTIQIYRGYAKSYRGEIVLSVSRDGSIEVVE